jgi:superfamily I DNA and RNA helicase
VAISNGPSYATKRQEALESMLQLTKAYPQVAQFAGDLMIKNMDWPGADEIAERIKKTIPPDITMSEKDKQSIQIPPQIQQQLQQMGQMVEQLTQQLHAAQDQIEQKEKELQSKERIELAKIEAGMREKLIEVAAKDYLASFEAEIAQLDQRQKQLEAEPPEESESYENAEGMSPLMPQNPNNGDMQ